MSCSSGCCCGSSSSGCPCDSLFEAVPSLAGIPASLYGGIVSTSGGHLNRYMLGFTIIALGVNTFLLIVTVYIDVITNPSINIRDRMILLAGTSAVLIVTLLNTFYLIFRVGGFWSRVREFLGDPSIIDYYIKIAEDLKIRVDVCCSCCGCCSQLVREWVDKVLEDTKSQLEDIKRRGLLEMIKKTR